jgi:PepSY-associated transmembrane protein
MRAARPNWKNVDFLLHRWLGLSLGLIVLVWFVSGVAMMYYPYPQLTSPEQLRLLPALRAASVRQIVGFEQARVRAGLDSASEFIGGRLKLWNGRPTYELWTAISRAAQPPILVDAMTGARLAAIDAASATRVAERLAPANARVNDAVLLPRGDHYFMGAEWRTTFPVFRIVFDDPGRTTIYVSSRSGEPVAVVNKRARWTTWLGTVPHWIYVQWLYYDHYHGWFWISILLPGIVLLLALSGVVLGVWQLFPFRRRADWRLSGYRGVSRWHHTAGILFGMLVLTWTLSGLLEVLGPSWRPSADVVARVRGATPAWDSLRRNESDAIVRAESSRPGDDAVALDVMAVGGHVGYVAHFRSGTRLWVEADASAGPVRTEIDAEQAALSARRVIAADARVVSVTRLTSGDAYYYTPRSRSATLPVWRVQFADRAATAVYVDPVTALPAGVVDASVRRWRWWRDGLHDFDFPGINGHHPLWDAIVLPLLLGGSVCAITGVWMLVRRLRIMARPR